MFLNDLDLLHESEKPNDYRGQSRGGKLGPAITFQRTNQISEPTHSKEKEHVGMIKTKLYIHFFLFSFWCLKRDGLLEYSSCDAILGRWLNTERSHWPVTTTQLKAVSWNSWQSWSELRQSEKRLQCPLKWTNSENTALLWWDCLDNCIHHYFSCSSGSYDSVFLGFSVVFCQHTSVLLTPKWSRLVWMI